MQLNLTLSTLLISDSLDMRASYLLRYCFNALAGERFGRFSGGLTKKKLVKEHLAPRPFNPLPSKFSKTF